MASPVLELRSVTVKFGEETVLNNISLSVQKGEIFVVVGPSGHGKSTLLKTLAGLVEPVAGEVFVYGQDFLQLSATEQDVIRRKMGMLFQKNALFDSLTASENIAFPLQETTDMSTEAISQRAQQFLDAVGIGHASALYPDEISGGMQKRLGIARALALDPEIIYYDDPTAGLDPITSRKIVDLILHLRKTRGSTAVAITNDMNRAFQMATRIGMVVSGELIVTGSPEETRRHPDPRVQQFISGSLNGPLSEAGANA